MNMSRERLFGNPWVNAGITAGAVAVSALVLGANNKIVEGPSCKADRSTWTPTPPDFIFKRIAKDLGNIDPDRVRHGRAGNAVCDSVVQVESRVSISGQEPYGPCVVLEYSQSKEIEIMALCAAPVARTKTHSTV